MSRRGTTRRLMGGAGRKGESGLMPTQVHTYTEWWVISGNGWNASTLYRGPSEEMAQEATETFRAHARPGWPEVHVKTRRVEEWGDVFPAWTRA